MTRRRWIADEVSGDRAALVGAHAEHLARVLRARVGQEFDIVAADRVRRGRITASTPERVEFALGEDVLAPRLPEVHLLLSVFKFDRFEWAVEKATELGVARIVPLIARRTDAHLSAAAAKRVERWRRIAREASQQSRRVAPPEVSDPVKIKAALAAGAGTRIVLAETGQGTSLKEGLASALPPVTLAVGPEGGWTEDERKQFSAGGWTFVSLGDSILRAETAAIAALAITISELAANE